LTKYIKYILLIILVVFLGYKSVYFKNLSEVKEKTASAFDAVTFTKKLWEEKLPAKSDSAISLPELILAIENNKEKAFSEQMHSLAIGNYRYALVKVTGDVMAINENDITVAMKQKDSLLSLNLATEFIYGNAIRDASGLVAVEDFPNTMELNSISEALNKTVREFVLPQFKASVKKGDKLNIIAAVELNKEHIKWQGLELIPVKIQITE
jgi:predicted lipoprotein